MITRHLAAAVNEALGDTPVVLVNGPRQSGKSTLVQQVAAARDASAVVTLDDPATLDALRRDPVGFIGGLGPFAVIDEVQRAPEIFVVLKLEVDSNRRPGRFLLTGSADVFLLPDLSDSLAGRMEIVTLWPLSQGEIEGVREGFVDLLFAAVPLAPYRSDLGRDEVLRLALRGGFPEVLTRATDSARRRWFDAYITTLLYRDIRDLASIEGLTQLPRLLQVLATRASSQVNAADISRTMGIPNTTLRRYITLLTQTFTLQPLPAWSNSMDEQAVRSPRQSFSDSGLLAHLLGASTPSSRAGPDALGPVLETFVLNEVRKQSAWSAVQPRLSFFRTHGGLEVDIILQARDGRLAGIEVKAAASVGGSDFKGLEALRDALGDRFMAGVVCYTGSVGLPFGDRLWALPIDALWRMGALPSPSVEKISPLSGEILTTQRPA